MGRRKKFLGCALHLHFVLFLGFGLVVLSQDGSSTVYIVTLKKAPTLHYLSGLRTNSDFDHLEAETWTGLRTKGNFSRSAARYGSYQIQIHDSLLRRTFNGEVYQRLYSYHYLINGFAIILSRQQADKLANKKEVANVVPDFSVRTATTHTPAFLGLPDGAWVAEGGPDVAGKGVVIGFVDTGIDPTHPSFADGSFSKLYPVPLHFSGICEVTKDFPSGSCNQKLIGARHFAASAISRGMFNTTEIHASPFDGDGHGTHTASIAAGNHGIPVIVARNHFGDASGMAPHAQIAVYKALYKNFGGFAADVVAAIDQAAQDGVDIISLSITPNRRPPGAAGNTGPSFKSISSFSPWIFTVGAAAHDRTYSNSVVIGNGVIIPGLGLARLSSIKRALDTAENLHAAGVIFLVDSFVTGYQINPTPMKMPGLIIPSPDDSKTFIQYYNSSLVRNASSKKIVRFGGVARISGGVEPSYNNSAPKVLYYSARGPDPENAFLDNADFMKPNLVAPGSYIWAAWSAVGTDSREFEGERFALISGTSMAAPHIAGLAALIKQKFPRFSPAAIASALSTTASLYNKQGGPIMAQRAYSNPDSSQSPATPFDMGSGFANATAALNPGLVFDAGYEDFFSFLCGINGSGPDVLTYTGKACGYNTLAATDLNLPSITVSKLNRSLVVHRIVTNAASDETYRVSWSAPFGVSITITPTQFFIASGQRQNLTVLMNATSNNSTASFGKIVIRGSSGHILNIPISVISKTCV
ncbi:unnamed protein product [Victoria cruziana]